VNTNATFQDFDTYKGAGYKDFFGYGEAFRGLPGTIPSNNIAQQPPSRQRVYAGSFRNIWETETTTAPPNYNLGCSVGGRCWRISARRSVSHMEPVEVRPDEIAREFQQGIEGIDVLDDFTYKRSTSKPPSASSSQRLRDRRRSNDQFSLDLRP
jgi:hypothetical protein